MEIQLHDVLIRTRGADPELPTGLFVDGHELLIPQGSHVRVDLADDQATTITITILAGSLRLVPEDV